MAEPIITTQDSGSTSIDENLVHTSPKQRQELGASMDKFFAEQDAKAAPKDEIVKDDPKPPKEDAKPPKKEVEHEREAKRETKTVESPKQEPKKQTRKPSAQPTEKVIPDDEPAPKEEIETEKEPEPEFDEPDEDLDRLKLKNPSPESEVHFKELKKVTKITKAEAKTFRENFGPIAKEFGIEFSNKIPELRDQVKEFAERIKGIKESSADPEEIKRYKEENAQLSELINKHRLGTDSHFDRTYRAPVQSAFEAALQEAVEAAPAAQRGPMTMWAEEVKKFGYDKLTDDFWTKNVIEVMPDSFAKTRVGAKVVALMDAKRTLNKELSERANPENFKKYQEEQGKAYADHYRQSVLEYVTPLQAENEWAMSKDIEKAKNAEERKAWEAHNKRQAKLDTIFRDVLTKASSGDGRSHAHLAWETVRMSRELEELPDLKKELKDFKARAEKAEEELDRIRHVSRVPGRANGASTKPAKAGVKPSTSVHDAFAGYEWPTGN